MFGSWDGESGDFDPAGSAGCGRNVFLVVGHCFWRDLRDGLVIMFILNIWYICIMFIEELDLKPNTGVTYQLSSLSSLR